MEDRWKMALHRANLILWLGLVISEYEDYRGTKKEAKKN